MKIVINIKTDNAAFEDDRNQEIQRIIEKVTTRIQRGEREGICMDYNGNTVGNWKVTGK